MILHLLLYQQITFLTTVQIYDAICSGYRGTYI